MLSFFPDHPLRAVNWRWRLASLQLELTIPKSQWSNDPWVQTAMQIQKQLYAGELSRLTRESDAAVRCIATAFQIWDDDQLNRSIIEARLLARESFQTIAKKTGLPVYTVKVYEALFFNVHDKLDHETYILSTAIGPSIQRPVMPDDFGDILKLVAYKRGPLYLEHLLQYGQGQSRPTDRQSVQQSFRDSVRSDVDVAAFLAALTMPVNDKTALDWLRLGVRTLRQQRRKRRDVNNDPDWKKRIELAFIHIPFPGHAAVTDRPTSDAD